MKQDLAWLWDGVILFLLNFVINSFPRLILLIAGLNIWSIQLD